VVAHAIDAPLIAVAGRNGRIRRSPRMVT